MIAHLSGIVIEKAPHRVAIDVNGVGYDVQISLTSFESIPEVDQPVRLTIYTHVREDQIALYGFVAPEEKYLFGRLIGVSGVGPKMALAILSGLPAQELITAIAGQDRARLATIPGVGKKTAERIVMELKDRLAREMSDQIHPTSKSPCRAQDEDTLSALTNLGYPRAVAEKALNKLDPSKKMTLEDTIRGALRELCRV